MKNILFLMIPLLLLGGCGNTTKTTENQVKQAEKPVQPLETIRITNHKNFDVTFKDRGFYSWLSKQSPRSEFYESSLEIRNLQYVTEWNKRASDPGTYNPELYTQKIDYKINPDKRYGLDVNYELFQYFRFFELSHEKLLLK